MDYNKDIYREMLGNPNISYDEVKKFIDMYLKTPYSKVDSKKIFEKYYRDTFQGFQRYVKIA